MGVRRSLLELVLTFERGDGTGAASAATLATIGTVTPRFVDAVPRDGNRGRLLHPGTPESWPTRYRTTLLAGCEGPWQGAARRSAHLQHLTLLHHKRYCDIGTWAAGSCGRGKIQGGTSEAMTRMKGGELIAEYLVANRIP